jgi:hypothetical protein
MILKEYSGDEPSYTPPLRKRLRFLNFFCEIGRMVVFAKDISPVKDGYIHLIGRTNAGKWHPVPMKNKDPYHPKGGDA